MARTPYQCNKGERASVWLLRCTPPSYLGEGGAGTPIRCWIIESSMSEYCCIIWTISGLFSDGCGDDAFADRSSSMPAGGNCRVFKLAMMGTEAEESNCSNSALSRSDRLDSDPSEEPVPPARRRWSSKSCSVDVFIVSMANSHEARDKTLLTSGEGPLSAGVVGADRGAPTPEADDVGVTGLLKRLRRAGLLFGVGVKRTERAGLRPTLFSKFITLALTLVFGSVPPASSELDESCNACWMSPVETADEMRRGAERDLIGVPAPPLLLPGPALPPPGAILLAELMVGRMADGVDTGREIDPKDGDLETPEPTARPRDEWTRLVEPEALDCGRFNSPSESVVYNRMNN